MRHAGSPRFARDETGSGHSHTFTRRPARVRPLSAAMTRGVDEGQNLGDERIVPECLTGLGKTQPEKTPPSRNSIRKARRSFRIRSFSKPRRLSPIDVQSRQPRAVADHAAERDHVAFDAETPPIIAARPMRTNWCSRGRAADHRVVADGDMTAHHRIVRDDDATPSVQSWATWTTAISRQSEPIRVTPFPVMVPRWIVQCSRIWVRAPISHRVGSPWYFRSCGGKPDRAERIQDRTGPIWACPSTTMCETSFAPSSMMTSGPTVQNGPIRTPRPISAPRATTAVGRMSIPAGEPRSYRIVRPCTLDFAVRSLQPSSRPLWSETGPRAPTQ